MTRAAMVLGVVAVLAAAGDAHARRHPGPLPDTALRTITLPPALPGAVLTAAVDVPPEVRGRGSAALAIRPAARVRLFGSRAANFAADQVPTRIPLTFILPRDQSAGALQVATVTLTWADGTVYTTELRLDVQPVRRLRLAVSAAATATSTRPLIIRYSVANLGNARDTLVLRALPPAHWAAPVLVPLELAEGDSASGAIRVLVPRDVPGDGYAVAVQAAGRADTVVTNVFFAVSDENPSSSWVPVPATLFAGMPGVGLRNTSPEFAFQASGAAGQGTTVSLLARHGDNAIHPRAFNSYLLGPEFLASVERPDLQAAVGDVFVPAGGVIGAYGFGTGARFGWRKGSTGDLFLARPRDLGSGTTQGHLARGSLGFQLPFGETSLRLTDFERPLRQGLPSDRMQGATVAFESGQLGAHHLSVEAGYARVSVDSGETREGPALDAAYTFRSGASFLVARARRIPGVTPGGTGSNESYIGAGVPLLRGLQAVSWLSSTSVPVLGAPETNRSDAALGLRAAAGGTSLLLRGNYSRTEAPPSIFGGTWIQRTVSGALMVPLGSFALDALGEVGTFELNGVRRPLRSVNARASMRTEHGTSLWLGSDYSMGRFGELPLRLDGGGEMTLHQVKLAGGGGAYLTRREGGYLGYGFVSATVPVRAASAIVAGVEYQPWLPAGERTRISLGARVGLSLPVPVPGRAAALGQVFDDRNGNGVRDPDEPALSGVGLRLGNASTTTDPRGHFAFPHATGSRPALEVDMTSLPSGWLVQPYSQLGHRVNIALVRAGMLRIRLVEEREKPRPDSAGAPVPDTWIELVDSAGRTRSAMSDSAGAILFAALPPGAYTLVVHPENARGTPLPTRSVPLQLRYGARQEAVVPIPPRTLQIRFKTPAPAPVPADPAPPTPPPAPGS